MDNDSKLLEKVLSKHRIHYEEESGYWIDADDNIRDGCVEIVKEMEHEARADEFDKICDNVANGAMPKKLHDALEVSGFWKAVRADQKQKDIAHILDFLEGAKLQSDKFDLGRDYRGRVDKEIIKISKETHNFPHYTTCHTCEDGWDMQIDFLKKELTKWANNSRGRLSGQRLKTFRKSFIKTQDSIRDGCVSDIYG